MRSCCGPETSGGGRDKHTHTHNPPPEATKHTYTIEPFSRIKRQSDKPAYTHTYTHTQCARKVLTNMRARPSSDGLLNPQQQPRVLRGMEGGSERAAASALSCERPLAVWPVTDARWPAEGSVIKRRSGPIAPPRTDWGLTFGPKRVCAAGGGERLPDRDGSFTSSSSLASPPPTPPPCCCRQGDLILHQSSPRSSKLLFKRTEKKRH